MRVLANREPIKADETGTPTRITWVGNLEESDESAKKRFNLPDVLNNISSSTALFLVVSLILLNLVPPLVLRFVGNEMYPFFIVVFLWIASYIFLLGALLLLVRKHSAFGSVKLDSMHFLLISIAFTVISRVLLIGSSVMISLDTLWYLDFGKFLLRGDMPYADFYFPYPPVFGYFIWLISLVAPMVDSFRILALVFDVAIVFVLWHILKSRGARREFQILPLVYALFPIAIIESGLNGHFESIANLFLLLAIWFLIIGRHKSGGVFIGLATATKIYAGFLLPVLVFLILGVRKKTEFALVTIAAGILTFIPFSFPVWLRGDFILPGFPTSESASGGFFDSVFGFLFRLSPFHAFTIALVGVASLLLVGVLVMRRSGKAPSTRPFTYDVVTLSLAILIIILALIAAAYPFTFVALTVYWRYPADIALIRGISTIIVAGVLLYTAWSRLKRDQGRSVSSVQKMLLASVALMLLLTISRNVFYGWYLLWAIPALLLIKDRRVLFTVLVCMLLIYPSYTHDNFVNLGYSEEKTWRDNFVGVGNWTTHVEFGDSGIPIHEIEANVESVQGIGSFSIDASQVTNESALSKVTVRWSRNVSIPITSQTEFVDLVSASWDPTFGRYADFGLFFESINATGHTINGTLNSPSWSPTNLTFVFWRSAFSNLVSEMAVVELTRLHLIAQQIRPLKMELYIDIMYTTEYSVITWSSLPLMLILVVPNLLGFWFLNKVMSTGEFPKRDDE